MNIEDVKRLTDKKLNIAIAKSLGYKAVKVGEEPKYFQILSPDDQLLGKTSVVEQLAWESAIPKYSSEVVHSREAQAKAIEIDVYGYAYSLRYSIHLDEKGTREDWDKLNFTEKAVTDLLAKTLQATPRQIAEAAYITFQSNNK